MHQVQVAVRPGLPADEGIDTPAAADPDIGQVLVIFWPLTFGAPTAAVAALLGMRRVTAATALTTTACLVVTVLRVWAVPAAGLADLLGAVAGAAALLLAELLASERYQHLAVGALRGSPGTDYALALATDRFDFAMPVGEDELGIAVTARYC